MPLHLLSEPPFLPPELPPAAQPRLGTRLPRAGSLTSCPLHIWTWKERQGGMKELVGKGFLCSAPRGVLPALSPSSPRVPPTPARPAPAPHSPFPVSPSTAGEVAGHSQDVTQLGQLLLGHLPLLLGVPVQVEEVVLPVQAPQAHGALRPAGTRGAQRHEPGHRAQAPGRGARGALCRRATCSPGSAPGSRASPSPEPQRGRLGHRPRSAGESLGDRRGHSVAAQPKGKGTEDPLAAPGQVVRASPSSLTDLSQELLRHFHSERLGREGDTRAAQHRFCHAASGAGRGWGC